MIAMLEGVVDTVDLKSLIVDVGGVGYEVFAPMVVLSAARLGERIKVYTYHHVREDDVRLFGFSTREELELFKMFLGVDGVGPKVALAIFSSYRYEQVCQALHVGDERFFASVSGLGKKNAAKIVLELRGKVSHSSGRQLVSGQKSNSDVVDALVALGYLERDVMGVVQDLDSELSVDEQIRVALKKMSK